MSIGSVYVNRICVCQFKYVNWPLQSLPLLSVEVSSFLLSTADKVTLNYGVVATFESYISQNISYRNLYTFESLPFNKT
jgi:hypothetical protein